MIFSCKIIIIIYLSIVLVSNNNIFDTKSMSTYIDDQLQIKLLNELYKMENKTIFKGKTLVIYDLY